MPAGVFVTRQFQTAAETTETPPAIPGFQTAVATSTVPSQPLPGHGHLLDTGVAAVVEERLKENSSVELSSFASSMLAQGNPKAAIQAYNQALALSPNDEDLHYNIGIAYGQIGDITNAEHHYREALRLLPDYPEVRNNLGNLLLRTGRLEEAEQMFEATLKDMPDYAQAHNNLGTLRQRQNRLDEALACFRKAVECDTNYWQAHFNLGTAYLAKGEKEKAASEFRETLRINPTFETAERSLARALGQTLPERPQPTSQP